MKGAVAAGHPLTASAGARMLEEGGNAVDACVAAAFAGAVCESFLTSPGAGGFMLVHRARDRTARLADFFVSAPGLGLKHTRRRGDGGDRRRVRRQRDDPAVPDRPCDRRGSRRRGGPRGRPSLLRSSPVEGAARAGDRARARRDRADAPAGAHPRAARPDHPPLRRGAPGLQRPSGARLVAGDTLRLTDLARHLRRDRPQTAPPRSTAASGRARWSRPSATAAAT